jgi:polyhydroxyalkanoate synthesis regulator phasin
MKKLDYKNRYSTEEAKHMIDTINELIDRVDSNYLVEQKHQQELEAHRVKFQEMAPITEEALEITALLRQVTQLENFNDDLQTALKKARKNQVLAAGLLHKIKGTSLVASIRDFILQAIALLES